jgi:hypothetical protein
VLLTNVACCSALRDEGLCVFGPNPRADTKAQARAVGSAGRNSFGHMVHAEDSQETKLCTATSAVGGAMPSDMAWGQAEENDTDGLVQVCASLFLTH